MNLPHLYRAVRALRAGGLVAYPTEAVWGLGCDPRNAYAVQRLLRLKQRDPRKGLILIAADLEQLAPFLAPLSAAQLAPVVETWPGPATWLLPASARASSWITGGRDSIAVRVTAHAPAAALCSAFGAPLVSTSANLSGQPPALTALEVRRRLGHDLDALLPGDTGGLARPTPIRDWATGKLVRE